MRTFLIIVTAACVSLFTLSACGGLPFLSQSEPTATPTRRVRPTFTPKPQATPTEEQPTEEPLPTEKPTQEPVPTDTPEPVTVQPTSPPRPRPTNPPAPTAPPAPQFSVNATSQYLCDQQGIYKIIINAKKGRTFAGGLVFGVFDQGGRLLQDAAGKDLIGVTQADINISIGSNCRAEASFESPNSSNGELDVGDAVRAGNDPVIVRFVKSTSDLTPISPDLRVQFGAGGQYWIYIQAQ